MTKKIKFYTKEENDQVISFANSNKPLNKKLLDSFCKKYNRSYHSVCMKIYDVRKTKPGYVNRFVKKNVKTDVSLVKDNSHVGFSKGEVKIPITNFNIKQEKDGFYFIIKF